MRGKKVSLGRLAAFAKRESVLCAAIACAVVSLFISDWTPSGLLGFVKWKTLCVLASLMLVVAGFKDTGVFDLAAAKLTRSSRRASGFNGCFFLCLSLILLPFFAAMLITNDVSLLTFVPLGLFTLERAGRKDLTIRVTILQAIAANLGSMQTPFGNPHNLECFIHYDIGVKDFFAVTLLFFPMSLIMLTLAAFLLSRSQAPASHPVKASGGEEGSDLTDGHNKLDIKRNVVFGVLAAVALLTVFNVIPYYFLSLGLIALVVLIVDKKLFLKLDWCLLLTFVCFFIFSGNLSSIDAVRDFIEKLTERNTFLTGALSSQVICNIPTTLLLESFTDNWKALMIGTDVGGLGTPIASMANLIAIKAYMRTEDAKHGRFMIEFVAIESLFLAALIIYSHFVEIY